MKVKDLKAILETYNDETEVRVLDVLHHPMPNFIMSHRAECVVNDERFFCLVAHGAGLYPINRDNIPNPIEDD